jgi:glycine cleavage system H protein
MSKKYTKEHEWIEADGDSYRVGITHYAQEQLGDVVTVELPETGRTLAAGEECAVIESVKAASDIYSPAAGEVTAINDALADDPAMINESPESDGWLWKMTLADAGILDGLMDADAYAKFVEEAQ